MPRCFVLLAVLTAALLTGCSPAARLIGKWEVDAKPVAAPDVNPLAAVMAAGMQAMFKIDAEFKADGTWVASGTLFGQTFSKQGKWRYEKSEGNALVLQVQMDGDPAERELRVSFSDDDHLEMVPPGAASGTPTAQSYRFKRVKPS